MKVCPKCNKTYDDPTLNFCLDDGSVLNAKTDDEPPPTVMMEAPQPTAQQNLGTQPTNQTFDAGPRYQSPSAGGSKSWVWVLGILIGVAVLCGGGFVGLIAVGSLVDDEEPPTLPTPTPPPTKDTRQLKDTIDLSAWNIKGNEFVTGRSTNGELVLTSVDRYYYVILTKNVRTYNATVKLTVRNTTGGRADSGYGLIIHSDPSQVLAKDYAFVIRSDLQQYRIARDTNKTETNIVGWTRSNAIRKGTEVNELEVRTSGKDMHFYINSQFAGAILFNEPI